MIKVKRHLFTSLELIIGPTRGGGRVWSGGAQVLGTISVPGRGGGGCGRVERRCWVQFQCRGVLLNWIIVGEGPTALAVGVVFFFFFLTFFLSSIISICFFPLNG